MINYWLNLNNMRIRRNCAFSYVPMKFVIEIKFRFAISTCKNHFELHEICFCRFYFRFRFIILNIFRFVFNCFYCFVVISILIIIIIFIIIDMIDIVRILRVIFFIIVINSVLISLLRLLLRSFSIIISTVLIVSSFISLTFFLFRFLIRFNSFIIISVIIDRWWRFEICRRKFNNYF